MLLAMRTLVILAIIAFAPVVEAASWDKLDERWLDLWTRCRVAIEEDQQFNHNGLEPLGTRRGEYGRVGQVWRDDTSIFEVWEGQWERGGRNCDVLIVEGLWPDDPNQLITLIGTFEDERRSLIAAGTHRWYPIDRVADFGGALSSLKESINGCPVNSTLFVFVRRERYFGGGTGEQVAVPCSDTYPARE